MAHPSHMREPLAVPIQSPARGLANAPTLLRMQQRSHARPRSHPSPPRPMRVPKGELPFLVAELQTPKGRVRLGE